MTVKELIEKLQTFDPDHTVIVDTRGGLSCNTNPLYNVCRGFDWTHDRVVLVPELAVEYCQTLEEKIKFVDYHYGASAKIRSEMKKKEKKKNA